MSTPPVRQPKGIPVGGQFAAADHAEASITLAPQQYYDPAHVAQGVLTDLKNAYSQSASTLVRETEVALEAGETSYQEFLNGLIARNHSGRCKEHEFDRFDTERYCTDCLTSLMVEARTNPKPPPSPLGVVPVRPRNHQLQTETLSHVEDGDSSTETSRMTGDEQFDAAVRRLFKAPRGAHVEVIMEQSEDWSTYTGESSTEIKVKCDGREATFSHMGSLMKALDQAQYDPHTMALRFMQADTGQRPLLEGIAAVYINKPFSDPVPVFGKIRNVFTEGSDKFMDFLHLDGRREYIYLSRVAAILETDQSREYNENRRKLPESAATLGPVTSSTSDGEDVKRETRAVTASADLDDQLRAYLRVEDPSAPVTVRYETEDFYGVDDENYVATCAGKEVSFRSLDRLLSDVAN